MTRYGSKSGTSSTEGLSWQGSFTTPSTTPERRGRREAAGREAEREREREEGREREMNLWTMTH